MPGLASMLSKGTDKFMDFYKTNDKALLNINSKPKTYYHGTSGNFDEFKHGASGGDVRAASGKGFYVTSDPEKASLYGNAEVGGNVMPVHIKAEKLYDWPQSVGGAASHPTHNRLTPMDDKLVEELRAKGYDGIRGKRAQDEIIVFEPNQIKSVHNKAPTGHANIMKAAVPGGLAAESIRRAQMQRLEAQDRPLENQLLGF